MTKLELKKLHWFEYTLCNYFEVNPVDLIKKTRKRQIVDCRYAIMVYMLRKTFIPKSKIPDIYGLSHTMLVSGERAFNNKFDTDKKFRKFIQELEFAYNQRFEYSTQKYTGNNLLGHKIFSNPLRNPEDIARILVCH